MKNQKGFVSILIIILILILLAATAIFYQSTKPTIEQSKLLLKEIVFDPAKKIGNITYPAEIKELQKENLLTISCIQNRDPIVKDLEDEQLNSLKDQIKVQEGLFIGNFLYCEDQNSNKFIEYGIAANNGDVNNMTANIATINKSNKLVEVVTIPKIDAWYNRCTNPIALTKDGTLYLQCGGGDAGSVWFSIYKIDMNKKLSQKITECNSHDEGQNFTCK